ncbi:hypothetical protein N473_16890 [Pseudoalteromonas luteoviolacea CPMOR-1]|uniref:Uncharacterized protein n=1 Tax=Pseudoalteromonas luteoviolacea CPMOR-1 TaxID=1365248 RepID=A0A162AXW9_9GAMM|nr:hypothetical protein N473_16890 [Pseudoalteromonas luteoviolacea CPMOR-1]
MTILIACQVCIFRIYCLYFEKKFKNPKFTVDIWHYLSLKSRSSLFWVKLALVLLID